MKQKMIILIIITAILLTAGYFIIQNGSISSYSYFFQGMATGIFSVTIIVWIIVFVVRVSPKSEDNDSKKQLIYKNQLLLSAGIISLFTGTLLAMYNKEDAIVLFISTVIIIISMIFNIIYIRRVRTNLSKG